jgi:hypothetical protein
MVGTTLRSPGPGFRPLRFSDGSSIWMPPEATAQHWQAATQQGEAALDQKYTAQARAENRAITTSGKVYDGTTVHPNTPYGQLMGWINTHGGNALNRNPTAQTVNSYVAPVVGSAARITSNMPDVNPIIGGADLLGTGFNVGKHLVANVAPAVNAIPDYKTVPSIIRSATGTPELPPDASAAQRIFENTATMMANPKAQLGPTAARAAGSYVGGTAGNLVGGETGQYFGSLAGGAPGEIGGNALLRVAQPLLGGKQAPEVAAAGERQDIQPTAGMVMNPAGRWFEKAVGSVPLIGGPVKAAQDRVSTQMQDIQRRIAEQVYGGTLPGDVTPTSIGDDLISGARQGAANITQKAEDETVQNRADIGVNQPTALRPVYRGASQQQFKVDPATYSGLTPYINNLIDLAVQSQTPKFQAVSGPMPPGSAPFERVAAARTAVGASIPSLSGLSKGMQDDLYARLTETMRNAAVAKDPSLGVAFDIANENYQNMLAQRAALEKIGGAPVHGYDKMATPGGTTAGAPFQSTSGSGAPPGEGQAYDWFTSNLRSPSKLAPFADPSIVPNEYWRQVAGQWLSQLGQTKEATYRPEWMARDWNGPNTGVDLGAQTQLFTGPNGQTTSGITDMNDLATLGRNTVVPVERAGLSNTAGSVLAWKWLLDRMKDVGGGVGMLAGGRAIASGMESPTFVNAMSGNMTPFVDALYAGVPAATQNINQFQQNPPQQNTAYSP